MEFTILANAPEPPLACREELFGPVLIVHTFQDEIIADRQAKCTELKLFLCPRPGWMFGELKLRAD